VVTGALAVDDFQIKTPAADARNTRNSMILAGMDINGIPFIYLLWNPLNQRTRRGLLSDTNFFNGVL
jgi:hypothetical protein